MAINEQEYFQRAAGSRVQQKKTEPVTEEPSVTEPVAEKSKRGRKRKEPEVKKESEVVEKKIPVYEFSRDDAGKVVTRTMKDEIKGLNEQNFEIENNAIDNLENVIKIMIKEEYDKLSRCKVEIKLTEKMYSLYNKDVYKSQLKNLKDRQFQCITRIRLLNELLEEE